MTLDERIQALTESVELLSAMQRDAEQRFEKRVAAVENAVIDIKDVINRMGRILEHHDITIDDHGDRIDRLEGGGQ